MSTNPPVRGKITGGEILSDVPDLLALAMQANEAFGSGPLPTTAAGWVEKLGFAPGGIVHTLASSADKFRKGPVTIDEVAALLGLTSGGLIDKVKALALKVIAQAKTP
jgi:hypothetical protein